MSTALGLQVTGWSMYRTAYPGRWVTSGKRDIAQDLVLQQAFLASNMALLPLLHISSHGSWRR